MQILRVRSACLKYGSLLYFETLRLSYYLFAHSVFFVIFNISKYFHFYKWQINKPFTGLNEGCDYQSPAGDRHLGTHCQIVYLTEHSPAQTTTRQVNTSRIHKPVAGVSRLGSLPSSSYHWKQVCILRCSEGVLQWAVCFLIGVRQERDEVSGSLRSLAKCLCCSWEMSLVFLCVEVEVFSSTSSCFSPSIYIYQWSICLWSSPSISLSST